MKAWTVVRHGAPREALELREAPLPEPGEGELRVRVARTACNYNEIDGCYGRYKTIDPPLPYVLGMEALGTVDAVGPGADAWLGRRVVATATGATGAHAEHAVCNVDMVFDAPPALGDSEAAAFFFPFHVAWVSLFERARLQADETLLVHAGAGGVGSAAIQLGVAAGARVIATAGSPEKLDFCRKLGAEVALDYRATPRFAEAVNTATDGCGADVVCDLVGGDVTQESFRCTATFGRVMMTGFSGGIEAEDEGGITPRPIVMGNFSLGGVLMAYGPSVAIPGGMRINCLPRSLGERVHAELTAWLDAGRIRPVVGREARFGAYPEELERMERRETIGRTILDWS